MKHSLGAAEKKRIVGYNAQCSKFDGNATPLLSINLNIGQMVTDLTFAEILVF
jgi:hypothetical protein